MKGRVLSPFATQLRRVGSRLNVLRERHVPARAERSVAGYWTRHNVTRHHEFASVADSLAFFQWRSSIYHDYLSLMPVSGFDDKVVLDYGCGPGHDLVGFGHFSRPARLIGMDVSSSSLAESRDRLRLHAIPCQLHQLSESDPQIPLEDDSVDYIHSSGVLHHVPDPVAILKELARVLRPGGECRIMIYNYDSVFLHLHVPYVVQLKQGMYRDDSLRAAFRRTTDGVRVPISEVYEPSAWIAIMERAGFACEFTGAAVSMLEMQVLAHRADAIIDRRLAQEHREFLLALRFDDGGWPLAPSGHRAGIDGCFLARLS